jgi:DNA repair protein RecO (recombination protein O)
VRYFKASGFILKRSNFSESDRLVTLFTKKYGKIRALAKGIRKVSSRRASHLEIFNEVRVFLYKGKTFNYLTEVKTINSFSNLRKDLSKIAVCFQMCELVEKMSPEDQEQEKVYDLLSKGINYINETNGVQASHLEKVGQRFTSRLLRLSGFLAKEGTIDPEEYAQVILERRLASPKFLAETYLL